MISPWRLLLVMHLVGLALGVGAATLKLVLVLKCRRDRAFMPVYLAVAKLITRQIVLGVILLTLSGVGWLLLGYPLTSWLIAKIALVAAIWTVGLSIDNVVEPRLRKLAPAGGEAASSGFIRIQERHLVLEVIGTLLFYAVVVLSTRG